MFLKWMATFILVPIAASAATLVIPASGSGPGASGSSWQSEVTLHNMAARAVTVVLTFHDTQGTGLSTVETIPARHTASISDIVSSRFHRDAAVGAITIDVPDNFASRLTVSSRTFNHSSRGDFGQDIPALGLEAFLGSGDTGVIAGATDVTNSRMNFGIYTTEPSTVHWQLVRADGTVAGDAIRSYPAGVQQQYSAVPDLDSSDGDEGGCPRLFATARQNDDVIYAQVVQGRTLVYGSTIDETSGDPTYVAGVRARQENVITFVGVDVSNDGRADFRDSDHDGAIDVPVDVFMSALPNYLHFIANGPNGEKVKFSLLDPVADANMLTEESTLVWKPRALLSGQTFLLRLLATTGSDSEVLTVPIHFR
jgi:hypothetical protein